MNLPLPARVTICLVLFLLGVSSAAAQDQTLTGWFSFTVADYPTESGLASEITYTLTEDSGERYELLIDIELMQPFGGPVTLNRKRVTVEGEWEQSELNATEKFRVYAIELAASPLTAAPGRPFAADVSPDEPSPPRSALPSAGRDTHVRGSQAWVTILCRFGDATNVTPHPVSFYEKMTRASYPALGHYWNQVSYGNLPNLAGSKVVGWYNLPRPQSYYRTEEQKDYDIEKIREDCTAAADPDVFFPDFDGFNLVFNRKVAPSDIGVPARGGSSYATLDGEEGFRANPS